jgi:hypothetical protein
MGQPYSSDAEAQVSKAVVFGAPRLRGSSSGFAESQARAEEEGPSNRGQTEESGQAMTLVDLVKLMEKCQADTLEILGCAERRGV